MNAKIQLLRSVPLFQGCSKHELEAVASLADEIDLPAGRELTHEGQTGKEFVVLVDGVADVIREGEVINKLGPGDFLGEIALVTGEPRTATVTARTPVRALVMNAPAFRGLLSGAPAIQSRVMDAVEARRPAA